MKGYDFITTLIRDKILNTEYLHPYDILLQKQLNKKEIVGAEIGVLNGKHALCMLVHNPQIKRLYLIDPYDNYEGYDKYITLGLPAYYEMAKKRLFQQRNRIKFIKKSFEKAIPNIPDKLDFVYYDIHGDTKRINKFLELYYPKIKKNGIIGGTNYFADLNGLARAILPFFDTLNLKVNGINNDWWVKKP